MKILLQLVFDDLFHNQVGNNAFQKLSLVLQELHKLI